MEKHTVFLYFVIRLKATLSLLSLYPILHSCSLLFRFPPHFFTISKSPVLLSISVSSQPPFTEFLCIQQCLLLIPVRLKMQPIPICVKRISFMLRRSPFAIVSMPPRLRHNGNLLRYIEFSSPPSTDPSPPHATFPPSP